jgi:hypothetical protein
MENLASQYEGVGGALEIAVIHLTHVLLRGAYCHFEIN